MFPFERGVITGASSGIGRELARQMAKKGVGLALIARRKPELDATASEVCKLGGEAFVITADLANPEEVLRASAEAEKALDRPDLVIANAGIGSNGRFVDQSWESLHQTLMVNTVGPTALIRALLPGMIERRHGCIAGISSLASYRGLPFSSIYSASKAALSTLLESIRVETRGTGVSVTDIHPGYIRTPLTAKHTNRMPFLMDVDRAAQLILRAIAHRKAVYNFPWQMALALRCARLLPPAIYDRVVGGRQHP